MKRKVMALLVASIMACSMLACGGGSSAPASEPPKEEAPAEEAPAEEAPAEEEAAAELKGNLVIYTAAPESDNDAIVNGFKELHPDVEIELIQGNKGEGIARVEAEAANPTIDVFYTGISDGDGTAHEALFEPYVGANDADNPETMRSNGFYNYIMVSTCCICVNEELEAELGLDIKTYKDLTDPKLEGKVIFSDPTASSAAWNNVSNIMCDYGYDSDESWALIEGLLANKMVVTNSSSSCFKSVGDGEYVAGITYEGGPIDMLKDGAENIRIQYPEEGTGGFVFAAAIVKDAPDMEIAKAFIDWLTSKDGQQKQLDLGATQRRIATGLDFSNSAVPALPVELKARDMDWLNSNKEQVLAHWTEVYNKYN